MIEINSRYIIRRIDVLPESRVQYLEEQERYSSEIRGIGPCGGFSTQYACMCDYHTLPYQDEVAWVSVTHMCRLRFTISSFIICFSVGCGYHLPVS